MNFKTLAIAAVLATSAASTFASTSLGFTTNDDGSMSATFGNTLAASKVAFNDSYTFSLGGSSEVSDSITSSFTKNGPISGFNVSLYDNTTSSFVDSALIPTAGHTQSDSFYYDDLATGKYTLFVTGTSLKGGSYGGSLTVSAVPEPASVALMLAGLGCMGFVAKRRKQG